LLFVDDATSEILAADFVEHESYSTYTALCKRYFRQYGLPEAFYTDRFSVFRVNQTNVTTTDAQTQFERVVYKILTDRPAYAHQGREVTVCKSTDGMITALLGNTPLRFIRFVRQPKRYPLTSAKEIEWIPAPNHPWRTYGQMINGKPVQVPD